MDEYYDLKEEYIKKLEILDSYDRTWIEDYEERDSWEDHKNSIYFG